MQLIKMHTCICNKTDNVKSNDTTLFHNGNKGQLTDLVAVVIVTRDALIPILVSVPIPSTWVSARTHPNAPIASPIP